MKPSQAICESMREGRQARKMMARGIIRATWRGNPARMFRRMGCFISLSSAADLRRAGRYQLARYALYHANRDQYAAVNAGWYLP